MKFEAVKPGIGLTEGKYYWGSVALDKEDEIKIVVFNDNGRWHKYSWGFLKPVEE